MNTSVQSQTKTIRYAVVGTGGRVVMFLNPLAQQFREGNLIVGLCDTNPGRVKYYQDTLAQKYNYPAIPGYVAADFEKMLRETKPDVVIVTCVDAYHHYYIVKAMELGCDVITEKPMAINDEQCRSIIDTARRTGRDVRVTFNCRWQPGATLVRDLIAQGTIGQIIHVDMEYRLNTAHGASYFRRWHREKDKSGGLLVHKSTHHLDMVNWWIDAIPQTVFGFGRLAFYGRENAIKRGVDVKYDRYAFNDTTGDHFARHFEKEDVGNQLFIANEKYDGYCPDRNVFGDNITAEDTMSLLVKYRTGVTLNYSLNAYLPREGMTVVFNGDKGRIEYTENKGVHIAGQEVVNPEDEPDLAQTKSCVVHPMFGKAYKVPIPVAEGGHGGGDPLLQEQMFSHHAPAETRGRNAGPEQGAASVLIGDAGNKSIATGLPVHISDLCPQLDGKVRLSEIY